MKNESQVNCPKCGTSIDVQDILSHQLEDEIKKKYQAQIAQEKKKVEIELEGLSKAQEEFEQKKFFSQKIFVDTDAIAKESLSENTMSPARPEVDRGRRLRIGAFKV